MDENGIVTIKDVWLKKVWEITRRMKDGHDALGQETTVTGKEIIKVCRKLH